ncbi:hypothetical protein BAUCODRAFT_31170 [Baudoinia panamericana UAMH 10762]|uniref:INO80 complex subunit F domain-containing protein n=1 Tax=Baudoinia panamericana (strain UAMH 10762) TaxID=717646 RepID=M2NIH6_BAUPA|nr:uncharacterized protein BAUCODRAFT_31170 [Baudoinia panamericana UAMH 10762]EMC98895.1 hypothetical protein BAUCODRAFT_31170 [Baudoinia panamericana UAMH 10762]
MPPSDTATQNTPLAPSVEKAYYRKCIELKRRLNEVEAANDEMKIRRVRLDRAITKMRLERAFLLEQLSKRMHGDIDGSEGSADEGMATPPLDRPHRDKRRRHHAPSGGSIVPPQQPVPIAAYPGPASAPPLQPRLLPLDPSAAAGSPPLVPGPGGVMVPANAVNQDGQYIYLPSTDHPLQHPAALPPPPLGHLPSQHESPYGPPTGVPTTARAHLNGTSTEEHEPQPNINRSEAATGEALTAGPTIREEASGERRIVADSTPAAAETDRMDTSGSGGAGAGFTAVNR